MAESKTPFDYDWSSDGSGDNDSEYVPSPQQEVQPSETSSEGAPAHSDGHDDDEDNVDPRAKYVEYDRKVATRVYQEYMAFLGKSPPRRGRKAAAATPVSTKRSRGPGRGKTTNKAETSGGVGASSGGGGASSGGGNGPKKTRAKKREAIGYPFPRK